MTQNDNDNPYAVTIFIDDDDVIDPETAIYRFWIRAAKFCSLLPILYVPVDFIGMGGIKMNEFADQYYIFFVGTWFYAFISIPAVIGINFLNSRWGLLYGIAVNLLFAMFALFWLFIISTIEPPQTPKSVCPPLFGLSILLVRIFYVVMYVGTIYVFLKAWRPLGEEY